MSDSQNKIDLTAEITTHAEAARATPRGAAAHEALRQRVLGSAREHRVQLEAIEREHHNAEIEIARCEGCELHFYKGPLWWTSCPRCNTAQPRPIAEMLTDPDTFVGPAYVWQDDRGCRGRWVHRDELFVCNASHVDDLKALAEALGDAVNPHLTLVAAVTAELSRLRRVIAEMGPVAYARAEEQAQRAAELADEAGELLRQLEAKRAECESLRDVIAAQARGLGERVDITAPLVVLHVPKGGRR